MTNNDRLLTAGDVATGTAADGNDSGVLASATVPAVGRDLDQGATESPDVQGYGDNSSPAATIAKGALAGAVLGGATLGAFGAVVGAAEGALAAATVINVKGAYNAGYAAGTGGDGT
jgi:hypothetical protein